MRSTWGTCTFHTLPAEQRTGLSSWSGIINSGLYWCDGKRPLAALERLSAAENGKESVDLSGAFEACLAAGTMVQDNSDRYA